ncbi:rotatin-like isoform X2 [Argonauta hians]
MPVQLRDDVDFERIFQKLGHELEEIRIRALKNILSKLNYGLVCLSDLIQERYLFIRLLEWFNFPSAPMQSEILGLLHQLSEHSTACENLREIGAIDFLSHLRMDSPTSLRDSIDAILENLMKIPDLNSKSDGSEHIHYQQPCLDPVSDADPPTINNGMTQEVIYGDDVGSNLAWPKPASGFTMRTFPWLTLTQTDCHVLSSTYSLFQKKDLQELVSTCEFLRDVVFYDFPGEIFLQRPQIAQGLLEMLELSCEQVAPPLDYNTFLTQPNLLVQVCRTLSSLTSSLHTRLKYHQDPAFYTPKPEVLSNISTLSAPSPNGSTLSHSLRSTDTRFSALGKSDSRCTGDGRDGDSTMSSVERLSSQMILDASLQATDELEVEDVAMLQHNQMTLPDFCLDSVTLCLNILKKSSHLSDVSALVCLLSQTMELLSGSVTVQIWNNQSEAARKIVTKLKGVLDVLCELMIQHHHRNQLFDNRQTSSVLIVKSRQIFIALSSFLVSFLKQFVTVDQLQTSMPEILPRAIELVTFDECVSQLWPELHASMLGYLHQLANDKYCLYTQTARVCTSLQRTCCFLNKVSQMGDNSTDLLDLASSCILGVPYHLYLPFIHQFIDFCSQHCRTVDVFRLKAETQVFELVAKLLAHPSNQVREVSYDYTLKVVKECLNINEIASHSSALSQLGIKFLISPIVLQEIIFFGMADSQKKVREAASDILLYLLQAQLLVDGDIWQEFLVVLAPSLPVLQSYAEKESPLGFCIIGMVEPTKDSLPKHLPRCEKFRGVLRMMFSPNSKVRCEAVTHLLWFICHEKEQELKLPQVNDLKIAELPDFFSMPCLQLLQLEQEASVFNSDDVTKVYNIFCSTTLDDEMKKSALEQLAIMLLDHSLHKVFKELGGIKEILFYLHKSVLKEQASTEKLVNYSLFLPCCINILSVILQYSSTERHELKENEELYHTLLRVALLHEKDETMKNEVTKILTFLLFDEVILSDDSCKSSDDKTTFTRFSMPYIVCNRYTIPYKPPLHPRNTSVYAEQPFSLEPLTPSLKEMIRFAWNFAWHRGIDGLVQFAETSSESVEFPKHLELSPADFLIIKTSHLPTGLREAVHSISVATNHFAVHSALNVLHLYLLMPTDCLQVSCKTLHQLKWNEALSRFLQVVPCSAPDQWLLCEVLHFIGSVFRIGGTVPLHILQWLADIVYNPKAALFNLLHLHLPPRNEGLQDSTADSMLTLRKCLQKEVINLITSFLSYQPYTSHSNLQLSELRGDLSEMLLLHLNITEAPHFYNLASLQASLLCLMHVTARPGWSSESRDTPGFNVTLKVLRCLLEIISAFHTGRGGTVMSYMGKGVTKCATMSLHHLASEMEVYSEQHEKWPEHWLYMKESNRLLMETGLNWLLTLWAYRDPEVRCAGLGIAVTLSASSVGRTLVTANCRHIPAGIWGVVFTILLDSSESSMVRQQAAYLLVNLISKPLSTTGHPAASEGPVINDSYYQEPLVGLAALLVLLQHCHFYGTVAQLLAMYYSQPTISSLTFTPTTYSVLLDTPVTATSNTAKLVQLDHFQSDQNSLVPTTETIPSSGDSKPTPMSSALNSQENTPRSPRCSADKFPVIPTRPNVTTATTPALVTAMCHLLHNLVILSPEDTLDSLTRHSIPTSLIAVLDSELLEETLECSPGELLCAAAELHSLQLLQMHSAIVHLLHCCCVHSAHFRNSVLDNTSLLAEMVMILGVTPPQQVSDAVLVNCELLYERIFSVLSVLLQLEGSVALEVVSDVLYHHWAPLFGCVKYSLLRKQNESLLESCLLLLSHMFAEEGRGETLKKEPGDSRVIRNLLESPVLPSTRRREVTEEISYGSVVCDILMKLHEMLLSKPGDTMVNLSGNALKCLLAVSSSAKTTALKGGLVESMMEHLKDCHARLNLAFLQSKKNSSRKKQTESLLQDVLMAFQILTNLATQQQQVKSVYQSSHLPQLLHSLWCWCVQDRNLLTTTIHLLTSYTANCPKACSSLAYTHPVTQGSSSNIVPNRNQLSNNSLVHCLVHLLASEPSSKDNGQLFTSVFQLLSILMVSGECRNILLKVNFLNDFPNVTVKKTRRKVDAGYDVELCWLELLKSLSFSDEGQSMILKIKDSMERLLELCESGATVGHQHRALLVVRNIACHSSNKNKLLAYNQLIPVLLTCLSSEEELLKVTVATTLSALAYNNQKAKVLLKNANMLPNLQDSLQGLSEFSELSLKCKEHVQNVIELIVE